MKRIGITGINGFIGYHLSNALKLDKENFVIIPFDRRFFDEPKKIDNFVTNCDVIVHLAALNRHNDPDEIYRVNIGSTCKLIEALERTNSCPHVIVSSTIQEMRNNNYGKSKRESRQALADWSIRAGATYSGMIIPNVFGPFGKPFYNSVVATFCYQVSHYDLPRVNEDGNLKLIYVGELVAQIIKIIRESLHAPELSINHTSELKVSEILSLIQGYRKVYQEDGEIPKFNTRFEQDLFNTYRCYMPVKDFFPRHFIKHSDNRGHFVEIMRTGMSGQTSFSTTRPGITRGEHFHTRKIERFAVIQGKARIQLRRIGTNEVVDFELDGENPSYVDMPIWYTHNITNIGQEELITIFWINEPYNPEDPDTWFEKVILD